jgi:hypothetical protein
MIRRPFGDGTGSMSNAPSGGSLSTRKSLPSGFAETIRAAVWPACDQMMRPFAWPSWRWPKAVLGKASRAVARRRLAHAIARTVAARRQD